MAFVRTHILSMDPMHCFIDETPELHLLKQSRKNQSQNYNLSSEATTSTAITKLTNSEWLYKERQEDAVGHVCAEETVVRFGRVLHYSDAFSVAWRNCLNGLV